MKSIITQVDESTAQSKTNRRNGAVTKKSVEKPKISLNLATGTTTDSTNESSTTAAVSPPNKTPGLEEEDNPYRNLINSPRGTISKDTLYVSQIVPWKDDHLLPPYKKSNPDKKCLVLDLDETLVHSSFKPVECDFIVPISLEGQVFQIYVAKRPHVDQFLKVCGELFEVVVFTASLATYADAVLDLLDVDKVVDWRLFRESCSPVTGTFVKDLNRMGRPISSIIIIDNSPHSYAFNPLNAIPVQSWFNDQNDTELLDLIPLLQKLASPDVKDVKVELQNLLEVTGMELINNAFSNVNIYDEENNENDDGHHEEGGQEEEQLYEEYTREDGDELIKDDHNDYS